MNEYAKFVEHPRFGRGPRITGANPQTSKDFRVYVHFHSPPDVRVPFTAISADPRRQTRATLPVTHYYDVRRRCEDCQRPFLFFAEEQRHWYEELGFPLEADAVRCVPCRRRSRGVERTRARYVELHGSERSPEEDFEYAECLLQLVASGTFGRKAGERLRGVLRKLPPGERTEALAALAGEFRA